MRCRNDVLFAADAVQNLLCRVFVIHSFLLFLNVGGQFA